MWARDVQNTIFAVLFCGWLGGMGSSINKAEPGKLLTIEEVGIILNGRSHQSTESHLTIRSSRQP